MKGSSGKIKSITRNAVSNKPNLEYEYSSDGHHVYKKVILPNGNIKEIYYIRDAQLRVTPDFTNAV
ncbi:MAG: hypothetical protein Q8K70_08070 [Bacteroidota bacterium]|nr:hypothetical protein [Bacteroidota bacterium]